MAGSMLIMIPKTADFIRRRADNSSISGTTGLMKARAAKIRRSPGRKLPMPGPLIPGRVMTSAAMGSENAKACEPGSRPEACFVKMM